MRTKERSFAKTLRMTALNLVLSIAGLCFPAQLRAQFLGYVSPQTVVQTLASNVSCTGSAQNFVTANLGQTQHYATVSGNNLAQITAEIDGVDGAGNSTRISDVLVNAQLGPTPTTITGSGYFPIVRVSVTCSGAGANFSITYSGSSSTTSQPVGGFQKAQVEKALFLGAAANANQTINFQAPFGSTAGAISFLYQVAAVGGSTLQVTCSDFLLPRFTQSFNLVNATAFVQVFAMPAVPCTNIQVKYVSGGVTTGNITAEYIFPPSGIAPNGPLADGVVTCQPAGNFTACPPVTLGTNGITLPAGGTTPLSSIIDTQGAKQAALHFNCTQGTISVNVQTYAEDGLLNGAPTPTALALVTPLSAVAANTNGILQIGSESNPTSNTGTLSTSANVRFPQRALAFSFANAGASAGTCTARLYLSY